MRENDYSMLVLWSEDDGAFLAHVLELPGCIAHGDTREEAIESAQIAIENWVQTARELGRPVPEPMSIDAFSEQAAAHAEQQREMFENAVTQAVREALGNVLPKLVDDMKQVFEAERGLGIDLYRGQSWVGTPQQRLFTLPPPVKRR